MSVLDDYTEFAPLLNDRSLDPRLEPLRSAVIRALDEIERLRRIIEAQT